MAAAGVKGQAHPAQIQIPAGLTGEAAQLVAAQLVLAQAEILCEA